ncbi:MAG: Asparagine synthetase [glutamine-hydrolyzing] 1 [Burkholderiaceae bacterium]|nr:Asparagine synthetase [glutamine-hydrolyzing] 1 [Burkholderiaceae bacterium]
MNDQLLPASVHIFEGTTRDEAGRAVTDADVHWREMVRRHGPERAAALAQGDFAVAFALDDGSTFMAVDRFAVRTLCFGVHEGDLVVAARADTLGKAIGAQIDLQALYDYLYFHVIPSPRTVFQGVRRLPAAHFGLWRNGRLEVKPYWRPEFASGRSAGSVDSLKEEFQTLLARAVKRGLDGTKPGCFLSGGTDSSTIAGMIGRVAGPPSTYSIGFEAEGYDEMSFARIASRHFGTDHHEYYVTPADVARSLPEVAAHYDQPFGNSSALPAFYCAKMARENGSTRLLAGDGGDELFGGNTRYAKQRVFGVHDDLPSWLTGIVDPLFDNAVMAAVPGARKVTSYIRQAKVPMPDRMQTYNLLHYLGQETILTPAFLNGVDMDAPRRQQREIWHQAANADLLDRQLAYDWRYTLAECDLPKVCGTAGMAGVEVGFPMLDRSLVEFSMRLPSRYKLRGLKLRWFFKEALRDFLPREILAKKKHGFGLPFGVWAQRHPGLNSLARESLGALADRRVVQAGFVKALMDERLAEHPGYFGEMVWILTVMEQWLRRHAPDFRVAR